MMETQGGGGSLTYEVEREANGLAHFPNLIKDALMNQIFNLTLGNKTSCN